ncbi:MAG: PilZ domain-containing protein [Nitrospinota bacterium]|nr:PilZ domain-containing protein [Nitrospinota bacterium]
MDSAPGPFSRTRTRIPFAAPVTLTVGLAEHTYRSAYDISMNGVFVSTVRPLSSGTRARFAILLRVGMRQEAIEGECEVVRVVSLDDGLSGENPGPGMGLKFLELKEGNGEKLYQLIRHNSP